MIGYYYHVLNASISVSLSVLKRSETVFNHIKSCLKEEASNVVISHNSRLFVVNHAQNDLTFTCLE